MLEYVTAFGRRKPSPFQPLALQKFSQWNDPEGYRDNDGCITDDMVTDIYLEFVKKTCKSESSSYLKTRTGQAKHVSLFSNRRFTKDLNQVLLFHWITLSNLQEKQLLSIRAGQE